MLVGDVFLLELAEFWAELGGVDSGEMIKRSLNWSRSRRFQ